MQTSMRVEKSTTVRISHGLVRLAEAVAPQWVEGKAFALWGRPMRTRPRWGAELTTAHRFALEAGAHSLAAWEWNAGGPRGTALLVHGWSGNASQMGSFVEPLVQQGWHVVAVDLPAHGETSGNFATLPLLGEVLGALGTRLRPKVIVAHSFGAMATGYALTREGLSPEVVALLAAPAQLPPYLGHFVRQAGLSDAMRDRLLARVERILQQPVSELDLCRHAPRLGHVSALLVHDRSDVVVPVASSRELEAAWPGAQLLETEGLSHDRIRRDREVVARVIGFVGAHSEARPGMPPEFGAVAERAAP